MVSSKASKSLVKFQLKYLEGPIPQAHLGCGAEAKGVDGESEACGCAHDAEYLVAVAVCGLGREVWEGVRGEEEGRWAGEGRECVARREGGCCRREGEEARGRRGGGGGVGGGRGEDGGGRGRGQDVLGLEEGREGVVCACALARAVCDGRAGLWGAGGGGRGALAVKGQVLVLDDGHAGGDVAELLVRLIVVCHG